MKRIALVVLIAVLSGCAGSPWRIGMDSQEQLAQESTGSLINAWTFNKSKNARAELERRGTFTAEEWSYIEQNRFYVGMRELAVYACRGGPATVNTTRTAAGIDKQFVFGPPGYQTYVYTENGIVTAIQE